jgi:hypothetical protein
MFRFATAVVVGLAKRLYTYLPKQKHSKKRVFLMAPQTVTFQTRTNFFDILYYYNNTPGFAFFIDTVLLSAVFGALFAKLSETARLGKKFGGILGLAIGFATTYAIHQAGLTLASHWAPAFIVPITAGVTTYAMTKNHVKKTLAVAFGVIVAITAQGLFASSYLGAPQGPMYSILLAIAFVIIIIAALGMLEKVRGERPPAEPRPEGGPTAPAPPPAPEPPRGPPGGAGQFFKKLLLPWYWNWARRLVGVPTEGAPTPEATAELNQRIEQLQNELQQQTNRLDADIGDSITLMTRLLPTNIAGYEKELITAALLLPKLQTTIDRAKQIISTGKTPPNTAEVMNAWKDRIKDVQQKNSEALSRLEAGLKEGINKLLEFSQHFAGLERTHNETSATINSYEQQTLKSFQDRITAIKSRSTPALETKIKGAEDDFYDFTTTLEQAKTTTITTTNALKRLKELISIIQKKDFQELRNLSDRLEKTSDELFNSLTPLGVQLGRIAGGAGSTPPDAPLVSEGIEKAKTETTSAINSVTTLQEITSALTHVAPALASLPGPWQEFQKDIGELQYQTNTLRRTESDIDSLLKELEASLLPAPEEKAKEKIEEKAVVEAEREKADLKKLRKELDNQYVLMQKAMGEINKILNNVPAAFDKLAIQVTGDPKKDEEAWLTTAAATMSQARNEAGRISISKNQVNKARKAIADVWKDVEEELKYKNTLPLQEQKRLDELEQRLRAFMASEDRLLKLFTNLEADLGARLVDAINEQVEKRRAKGEKPGTIRGSTAWKLLVQDVQKLADAIEYTLEIERETKEEEAKAQKIGKFIKHKKK